VEPKKFRNKHGPEHKIQNDFISFVQYRGWHAERLIGNQLQVGIPDLLLGHPQHGMRWVDLKAPGKYEFTRAQRWKWPLWERYGMGVWIIIAATEEEYDKLFAPPNMREYWKDKYDEEAAELEQTMQELFDEYET